MSEYDELVGKLRTYYGDDLACRMLLMDARHALEALAGEVEQANVKATSMQRWIDHHNERADKAEAQVEALRGEVDLIRTLGVGAALETVAQKERAQKAEAEAARLKGALEFIDYHISRDNTEAKEAIRKALAGETT